MYVFACTCSVSAEQAEVDALEASLGPLAIVAATSTEPFARAIELAHATPPLGNRQQLQRIRSGSSRRGSISSNFVPCFRRGVLAFATA